MNIQQYYRFAANVALNGSLAAFVPVVLILFWGIYFSIKLPFLLMVVPFIVYSLICYQSYLIQQNRSNEVSGISLHGRTLTDANNLLITFLPAPSLRMLLFDESGVLVGEVRDKRFWWWRWFLPYFIDRLFPRSYAFYDRKNQLIGYYQIDDRKRTLRILNVDRQEVGIYRQQAKKTSSLVRRGIIHSVDTDNKIYVEGSVLFPRLLLRNEQGAIIGKLIKGWMPLEWGNRFQDANTPYMSFSEDLSEVEKFLILGMLVEYFRYTSH
ncbi:hypothetical protein [Bacillus marasmi]|uniref:hypothetical protein n=1 Tax=Bacillus marasmi TaxID=1926279 RepID=UPI0011C95A73|nr:hypothetical protein [Bacillus marasmi]